MSPTPLRQKRPERQTQRHERGVSLLVVLVLILAMGLMAAFGIRASSTSAAVAISVRSQALAMEASEAALRYCEAQALASEPVITIWEPPATGDRDPSRWKTPSVWVGDNKASATVPQDWLTAGGTRVVYSLRPECMVERMRLPGLPGTMRRETFLITARGFSPESSLRPDGRLQSGSEVWLQSTLEQ